MCFVGVGGIQLVGRKYSILEIISPYFEVKIIKIGRNTEGYKNAQTLDYQTR
jgi:hypothetical protein